MARHVNCGRGGCQSKTSGQEVRLPLWEPPHIITLPFRIYVLSLGFTGSAAEAKARNERKVEREEEKETKVAVAAAGEKTGPLFFAWVPSFGRLVDLKKKKPSAAVHPGANRAHQAAVVAAVPVLDHPVARRVRAPVDRLVREVLLSVARRQGPRGKPVCHLSQSMYLQADFFVVPKNETGSVTDVALHFVPVSGPRKELNSLEKRAEPSGPVFPKKKTCCNSFPS